MFWAAPGLARADGDPASDVLAAQTAFVPADAGIPAAEQAELSALLSEATRAGEPIRVAVIGGRADLGSVTALWGRPVQYARFLGQELALVYRGAVLVVMPAGYGLARAGEPVPGWAQTAAGLPEPGRGLGAAAIAAVERVAARAGRPLAAVHTLAPGRSRGRADMAAWVAFALGAVLVLAAWAASLRARPLSLGRR